MNIKNILSGWLHSLNVRVFPLMKRPKRSRSLVVIKHPVYNTLFYREYATIDNIRPSKTLVYHTLFYREYATMKTFSSVSHLI